MNFEKFKEILNDTNTTHQQKEILFLKELSEQDNVINIVLILIEEKIIKQKNLITDINCELSFAHMVMTENIGSVKKKFLPIHTSILNRIKEFYIKNKGKITHNLFSSPWGNENLKDIYEDN
jgi:hypothetical protein